MPRRSSRSARLDHEIRGALTRGYRVAYLVPNPRRGQPGQETMLRLWYGDEGTMPQAVALLRAARARGYTAWVTDASGAHVPVPGAMRPYPGPYSVEEVRATERETGGPVFRTKAPFLVRGRWQWVTWSNPHGNKHAAILEKARELGADAWDFGQADHEEADRAGF